MIGILIEQLLSRLSVTIGQSRPATNVLFALSIQDVLDRFDLHDVPRTATEDLQMLTVSSPSSFLPLVRNIPYPRNPFFTGRDEVLTRLATALRHGTVPVQTQAICGLAGVGKTQIAVIGDLFMPERQTHPSDHIVTVGSDGTFDTTIPVPSSWVPGSHHTIQAITQNVQASTQASIDVETQSSGQPSAVPSSAVPTTVPTAPPTTSPIPMPIVSGITPTTGPASGGTSITLSGAHLSNTTSVSFGSTTANNFHIDSDTQITAVSPAGSGTVDITVTTSGGTSATSRADQFAYYVVS